MNEEHDDRVQRSPDDWGTVRRDEIERYGPRGFGRLEEEDDEDHDGARGKVKGPGLAMAIVGGLWLLLSLTMAGFGVALPLLDGQGADPGEMILGAIWVCTGGVSAVGNAIAIFGGVRMRQCRGWRLALASAIILMVLNGLVGVLVGVWALVILVNPDVKREFEREARRFD
jgi:hypothetical protein